MGGYSIEVLSEYTLHYEFTDGPGKLIKFFHIIHFGERLNFSGDSQLRPRGQWHHPLLGLCQGCRQNFSRNSI